MVTNAVVGRTEAAQLKVSVWGVPGFTCRSAGVVIPDGIPVTSIVTGEENPPEPVTETETEPEEPAGRLRLDGETARLKSGGGPCGVSPEQPPSTRGINTAIKKSGRHQARETILCGRKANPS